MALGSNSSLISSLCMAMLVALVYFTQATESWSTVHAPAHPQHPPFAVAHVVDQSVYVTWNCFSQCRTESENCLTTRRGETLAPCHDVYEDCLNWCIYPKDTDHQLLNSHVEDLPLA